MPVKSSCDQFSATITLCNWLDRLMMYYNNDPALGPFSSASIDACKSASKKISNGFSAFIIRRYAEDDLVEDQYHIKFDPDHDPKHLANMFIYVMKPGSLSVHSFEVAELNGNYTILIDKSILTPKKENAQSAISDIMNLIYTLYEIEDTGSSAMSMSLARRAIIMLTFGKFVYSVNNLYIDICLSCDDLSVFTDGYLIAYIEKNVLDGPFDPTHFNNLNEAMAGILHSFDSMYGDIWYRFPKSATDMYSAAPDLENQVFESTVKSDIED